MARKGKFTARAVGRFTARIVGNKPKLFRPLFTPTGKISRARKLSGPAPARRVSGGAKRPLTPQATARQQPRPISVPARLRAQRLTAQDRRAHEQAKAARRHYKPTRADKGKLVFIGVKGQRRPQAKGRKGYLIEVTKTGKKRLVKIPGIKNPWRPRNLRELEAPATRRYRKKGKEFQRSRLMTLAHEQRGIRKVSGGVGTGASAYDFNERVVGEIAKSLRKALTGQASHRRFLVRGMALVQLPDGTTKVYNFDVDIARRDHIAVKLAGVLNFVRQKFYAFMARELAYDDYVSSGSANHIRRLVDNFGMSKQMLNDASGQPWRGRNMEVVKILRIEWKIEQVK